jgi:uncharacterized membrane protein (UPF0182 family)
VIPIEESLLYIRPLYLRSAGGRIPELRRVIVAYQNQIVMEPTLDAALDRLFPGDGGPAPVRSAAAPMDRSDSDADPSVPQLAPGASQRALEHYRRALEAQRQGNWAEYGEEIKRLGEALQELRN